MMLGGIKEEMRGDRGECVSRGRAVYYRWARSAFQSQIARSLLQKDGGRKTRSGDAMFGSRDTKFKLLFLHGESNLPQTLKFKV